MRYKIQLSDKRVFKSAFYNDKCVECETEINEGDPIGYLEEESGRYGPLCIDCVESLAKPASIRIEKD